MVPQVLIAHQMGRNRPHLVSIVDALLINGVIHCIYACCVGVWRFLPDKAAIRLML